MLKTLESLGFRHLEAEVYVYLTKNDPQKAQEIAQALETYRRQLYRSLKILQRQGMVNAKSRQGYVLQGDGYSFTAQPISQFIVYF